MKKLKLFVELTETTLFIKLERGSMREIKTLPILELKSFQVQPVPVRMTLLELEVTDIESSAKFHAEACDHKRRSCEEVGCPNAKKEN